MCSQEYFARVAPQWDELRAGFFPDSVRDTALALAAVRPGMSAADLGAGTGFVTAALLDAGLEVVAVDRSPAMLEELARKFSGHPRLVVLPGEACRLPLPSASVDRVFANMFLHHVDDPAAAIAEMARILKPGGRLVLTDLDSHAHAFLLAEHGDRWPGFARADVLAWLAAAGLVRGRVDCCGADCCAGSCCGGDSARISIFAASARKPALPGRLPDPEAARARALELWRGAPPLLCAEAVLQALAEGLGVDSPLLPRLATGFCSGQSRCCGPCGAFSAGVMALGLAFGRDGAEDDLELAYGPVQDFREGFLARFGSLNCRELTGFDLGDPAGLAQYRERGLKDGLCGPLLAEAAALAARIMRDGEA